LVGIVICLAIYLMRRLPAPLRYGLLVVALLKFAVPPLIDVPYASVGPQQAFSQDSLSVSRGPETEALAESAEVAAAQASIMKTASAPPPDSRIVPSIAKGRPVPTGSSVLAQAPGVSSLLRDHWMVLLLLAHLLGGIIAGLYVLSGFVRTWRFAAGCEGIEAGKIRRSLERVQQRMGLRLRMRLLLTSEGCAPMALGTIRPSVVLPRCLVETMSPNRLEAVLAHELAHHSRNDLWLMAVENLLLILWWFHPVFWLVRRGLCSVREDCCDDMILDARVADRETYCEILLQSAGHVTRPHWARAALGVSEKFHPLGRRFKRIMDTSTTLRARLSLGGALIVVLLAALLLPGMRFVEAKADDQTPASNTAAIDSEIAQSYAQADAEVKDFIKWTADHFGPQGLCLPENAFDKLTPQEREAKIKSVKEALEGPEALSAYTAMAEAAVLRDPALLPCLVKVAWYMQEGGQDNRIKWMAVAALGRLGDVSAVPVLLPLVDHYNKNVRLWTRASLVRLTGQNFGADKKAWVDWANAAGPQTAIAPAVLEWASRQSEERMKSVLAQQPSGSAQPGGDPDIEKEIQEHYTKADPEVQEFIRLTARTFGRGGLWLPVNAYEKLTPEKREKKILYAVDVLKGEYGRHLCTVLAEAGALKDKRLLPGVTKAAAYHREDSDYDCRAKWMAVAALGRQDDESAVPTLVPLVDHGNQNTRMWAMASLVRLTGQNFSGDKQAWGKWWNDSGKKPPIDLKQLKPWTPPPRPQTESTPQIQPSSSVPPLR
jgi:beta-lactamase regulating signal transducer with metallopeptidase domain